MEIVCDVTSKSIRMHLPIRTKIFIFSLHLGIYEFTIKFAATVSLSVMNNIGTFMSQWAEDFTSENEQEIEWIPTFADGELY